MSYNYIKDANLDQLTIEIQASSISSTLSYMNKYGNNVEIVCKRELSASEKLQLDQLVNNHIPG